MSQVGADSRFSFLPYLLDEHRLKIQTARQMDGCGRSRKIKDSVDIFGRNLNAWRSNFTKPTVCCRVRIIYFCMVYHHFIDCVRMI